jgi:hypothetical protein
MTSGTPDERNEINARLTGIEQKRQQLPTREELHADFVARDELILSTREEMRRSSEETRRHFDVVAEGLRDDIRLLAEGQVTIVALARLERHAGFEPPPRPVRRRRR